MFLRRHIGPGPEATAKMLEEIGAASIDELMDQIIPSNIRINDPIEVNGPMTEQAYLEYMRNVAAKNKIFRSFMGMGYYGCITPTVIQRNVFENPGWYTQYTPYQAEIAQGRLEALLNFQTLITELTGMEIANASLLDEPTAAAEAMTMLMRVNTQKETEKTRFFVSEKVFPQTIDVLKTRALPLGIELVFGDYRVAKLDESYFGALVQLPDEEGEIQDYTDFIGAAHAAGVLVTIAADLLSLVMLKSPGSMGADIVVGSAQRFGVPMGYGGPHAAFFATREAYVRQVPGRIIGISKDKHGTQAYRMALQTREQHIRREKATSNICTAQSLLAIMAAMYAVYHGPEGLLRIAQEVHFKARILEHELAKLGFKQVNVNYFDTIRLQLPDDQTYSVIRSASRAKGLNFRFMADNTVSICCDEAHQREDLEDVVTVFCQIIDHRFPGIDFGAHRDSLAIEIEKGLLNKESRLEQQVFRSHRSETEMLRYIKHLESRDLSLAQSMIPLGSCTMKLNATTEMVPVSWPQFANVHPFAPKDQVKGYFQIITELEEMLCAITGLPGVSLQPNSGAQGEFAGLMVIRAYLSDLGQSQRDLVLIPSSAHGTNPASAVMSGMRVTIVKCDEQGNIDITDLRQKAEQNKDNLAALMVTYPSTHGVYEEGIREICEVIHANGGQVYMDGANMNAQIGLTNPGVIGADVCHLNLHKTFSIPHGGGGPGMGPICCAEHLKPFLPGHSVIPVGGEKAISAISATPWGSASILLISQAYIKLLGANGLVQVTRYAMLNANYIKSRLDEYFPVLYQGSSERVAHEMILDFRPFKKSAGIEVEDVAKRLMDYGFHAPTVSFPVVGTLMVEPTESESKAELDRFCEAMISIHAEIKAIEEGKLDRVDNPLKNAPHTAEEATADTWEHAYSRESAVYPNSDLKMRKFWPPVGRIDNTYGDRNLVCTCPPLEAYA